MKNAVAIAESLLTDIDLLLTQEGAKIRPFQVPPQTGYMDGMTLPYLRWMCQQVIANPGWGVDKANRWLGWVQCALVCQGCSSLDDERNRVRLL